MEGGREGGTEGRMGGWMDGWMDGRTETLYLHTNIYIYLHIDTDTHIYIYTHTNTSHTNMHTSARHGFLVSAAEEPVPAIAKPGRAVHRSWRDLERV